jgi:Kef-type K+ transport system membrane component KefB/nucleotide-binding universal stress UspA family protein
MVTVRNGRFHSLAAAATATRPRRGAMLLATLLVVVPTAAAAAAPSAPSEDTTALFVAELGMLLLVGRLMGEAAQRIGQPPVMGQIIGGVLLGPSALGLIWPDGQHLLFSAGASKTMLDGISQLGILLLLLLTGMETDLALVKRVGRASIAVATMGVAIPFVCGVALGAMLPASLLPKPDARIVTALFLGTTLSISSVKIVAMIVRELNFMRRDIGQIIVASAILEDTIGWVIIAIAFGLASAGRIDAWSVGRAILGTVLFLLASLTVGRRMVFSLIRFANDNFRSEFPVITTILVVMAVMALITQWLGVNMVLGAFVAGVLIGESPILTRHVDQALRGLTVALFMPVFFGLAGLSADLTVLKDPNLALLAVVFVFVACIGKFLGAFAGGKLGGLVRGEALALACAMNARGSTEVIVASIGLSTGVLSHNLFTLIVTMAVITTVSMPPMLRWALQRLPMREEERIRLEREELDARGFVTNLERLLLVVDDSPNGRLAARVAGIIGGSGGKPTTILEMTAGAAEEKPSGKTQPSGNAAEPQRETSAGKVKSAAEGVTTLEAHPDEEKQGHVEVTTVRKHFLGPQDVAAEARKGYDLLVVGIANAHATGGGFSDDLSLIVKGFEGPLAVIDSRQPSTDPFAKRRSKILVPVNGTEVSRSATEVAFALARANDAQVTVLYVTRAAATAAKRTDRKSARAARRNDEAVLKDISALADRYGVSVRRSIRGDTAPDAAILKEAKRGYDLVVLGANRRPGETLFFGNTAAAVLDGSQAPKLFVAT